MRRPAARRPGAEGGACLAGRVWTHPSPVNCYRCKAECSSHGAGSSRRGASSGAMRATRCACGPSAATHSSSSPILSSSRRPWWASSTAVACRQRMLDRYIKLLSLSNYGEGRVLRTCFVDSGASPASPRPNPCGRPPLLGSRAMAAPARRARETRVEVSFAHRGPLCLRDAPPCLSARRALPVSF